MFTPDLGINEILVRISRDDVYWVRETSLFRMRFVFLFIFETDFIFFHRRPEGESNEKSEIVEINQQKSQSEH